MTSISKLIGKSLTRLNNSPSICLGILGQNRLRIGRQNYWSVRGALLTRTRIEILGSANLIEIGVSARLHRCDIRILGNFNRVTIGEGAVLNNAELWIEDDSNTISIGASTAISGKTHIAAIEGTHVSIGSDCLLSSDIRFATGDSHSVVDVYGSRINLSRSIEIADHVWIGTGVTLLKGTSIQKDSIVGANTLVNKAFDEAGVVIAGNPGRIVKREVNWLRERVQDA